MGSARFDIDHPGIHKFVDLANFQLFIQRNLLPPERSKLYLPTNPVPIDHLPLLLLFFLLLLLTDPLILHPALMPDPKGPTNNNLLPVINLRVIPYILHHKLLIILLKFIFLAGWLAGLLFVAIEAVVQLLYATADLDDVFDSGFAASHCLQVGQVRLLGHLQPDYGGVWRRVYGWWMGAGLEAGSEGQSVRGEALQGVSG